MLLAEVLCNFFGMSFMEFYEDTENVNRRTREERKSREKRNQCCVAKKECLLAYCTICWATTKAIVINTQRTGTDAMTQYSISSSTNKRSVLQNTFCCQPSCVRTRSAQSQVDNSVNVTQTWLRSDDLRDEKFIVNMNATDTRNNSTKTCSPCWFNFFITGSCHETEISFFFSSSVMLSSLRRLSCRAAFAAVARVQATFYLFINSATQRSVIILII